MYHDSNLKCKKYSNEILKIVFFTNKHNLQESFVQAVWELHEILKHCITMRECKWKASIKRTYLTFWKGIHGQQIQYNITWGYMVVAIFFLQCLPPDSTLYCTCTPLIKHFISTYYLLHANLPKTCTKSTNLLQITVTFLLNNIQKEQLFLKSTIQGLIDNLFIWSTIFSTWWLLYVPSYYWKHQIAICFH